MVSENVQTSMIPNIQYYRIVVQENTHKKDSCNYLDVIKLTLYDSSRSLDCSDIWWHES